MQRKLRRSVSVSQDEVLRAQQAQAAAPGAAELRLAALAVPIHAPPDADKAKALAQALAAEMQSNGNNLAAAGLAHAKGGRHHLAARAGCARIRCRRRWRRC